MSAQHGEGAGALQSLYILPHRAPFLKHLFLSPSSMCSGYKSHTSNASSSMNSQTQTPPPPPTSSTPSSQISKQSLSLALQLFYPLCGNLTLSPQTGFHEIRCADGDWVSTLAVSFGFVLVCLIKAHRYADDKLVYFSFAVDCRTRFCWTMRDTH